MWLNGWQMISSPGSVWLRMATWLAIVPDGRNSAVERKVLFAHDLDELWYVRPDLMTAIAAARGESVARQCLADITRMFDAGTGGKLRRSARSGPGKD